MTQNHLMSYVDAPLCKSLEGETSVPVVLNREPNPFGAPFLKKHNACMYYILTGPAEQMGLWRQGSTSFWKYSAISKTVRPRSAGQMVQKLQPIIDYASFGLPFGLHGPL